MSDYGWFDATWIESWFKPFGSPFTAAHYYHWGNFLVITSDGKQTSKQIDPIPRNITTKQKELDNVISNFVFFSIRPNGQNSMHFNE